MKVAIKSAPSQVSAVTEGFPTVNLLPAAVVEIAVQRRLVRQFGAGAVAVVALVAFVWLAQTAQIKSAQGNLEQAQAQTVALTAQQNAFVPIANYYSAVETQRKIVGAQMGGVIDTSRVLQQLDLVSPPGVVFSSVSLATGGAACPTQDPFTVPNVVGCLTLVGSAPSTDAVGDFLVAVKKDKHFAGSFVPTTTVGDSGVAFNGTVNITNEFLGKRYEAFAGTEKK